MEVPKPAGHVSSTRSPLSFFSPGPRFALWFLTVITESSSRGTCFSLQGLSRTHRAWRPGRLPAACPFPGPGAVPPAPPVSLSAPRGTGGTKGPSVPARPAGGGRLHLGGAPSRRCLPPPPAQRGGGGTGIPPAPRPRVAAPCCD